MYTENITLLVEKLREMLLDRKVNFEVEMHSSND